MILESRKFKKIAVACVFTSTLCFSTLQPVIACPEVFDDYQGEECRQTIHTTLLRRVTSCTTGQVIRIDIIGTTTSHMLYGRQYCVDGNGVCQFSDPPCPPEEIYDDLVVDHVCE